MEPEEKPSFFRTNYIQFMGGRNTLFTLIALLLLGMIIFIFREVSFIFNPVIVFMQTVVLPIILALILYYLLRPVLRLLERLKISRIWGIVILFLGVTGILTLITVLVLPFLREQFTNLIEEFPSYFMQLLNISMHFCGHPLSEAITQVPASISINCWKPCRTISGRPSRMRRLRS